jgi:hypothetical protein
VRVRVHRRHLLRRAPQRRVPRLHIPRAVSARSLLRISEGSRGGGGLGLV